MKYFVIVTLLIASVAHGADAPVDPRLSNINQMRTILLLERDKATLALENANLKLAILAEQEEKIKAEIKAPPAAKGKPDGK